MNETRVPRLVPTVAERNLADAMSRLGVTAAKLEAVDAGREADGAKFVHAELGRHLGITQ